MAKYSVALHGHAAVRVEVEADSYEEATRLAKEKAPKVRYVQSWTPVSASKLEEK
ncbi:hypothetical protein PV336_16290 [Streptomyces sp. MI02-2A]|uniref:hypothetical protein n=1 Tax=Streptomyces sp. MI02-2A TaxID=3028688 RepID=UPI0029ABA0A1|nr:hypothetical protein [Streptomyces sp. MI02-2A]MDX3260781.1 hypothetical protein [Streptomyces sp. MI02-2A]